MKWSETVENYLNKWLLFETIDSYSKDGWFFIIENIQNKDNCGNWKVFAILSDRIRNPYERFSIDTSRTFILIFTLIDCITENRVKSVYPSKEFLNSKTEIETKS